MPILPTVMPDEFILGYWGRVHILNLRSTPNETADALIDYFELPKSRIRRIEALALAARADLQFFVQNHTLIPAHGAISQHFIGMVHGNTNAQLANVIRQSWKLLQKPGAYFCPQCAVAQVAAWGFSYWKRRHQLLGVDWCLEHGEPLVSCPETAFVNATPCNQVATAVSCQIELETSCRSVLERYSKIMNAYLVRTVRVGVQEVAKVLRPIAEGKGISTRAITTNQYLSDIAVTKLPTSWLGKLFPSISTKRQGAPFGPLDNTVLSGFAMPHAYALAMALLYESSEEALADFPVE